MILHACKKEMFRYRTIEIGITVAFGGLAYAIRALGLVIPLGGGLLWDARRVAVMIALLAEYLGSLFLELVIISSGS